MHKPAVKIREKANTNEKLAVFMPLWRPWEEGLLRFILKAKRLRKTSLFN
jgi:hypothetical protein